MLPFLTSTSPRPSSMNVFLRVVVVLVQKVIVMILPRKSSLHLPTMLFLPSVLLHPTQIRPNQPINPIPESPVNTRNPGIKRSIVPSGNNASNHISRDPARSCETLQDTVPPCWLREERFLDGFDDGSWGAGEVGEVSFGGYRGER